MMDSIQVILSDRKYQGALENQHMEIKPTKPLPVPSEQEYLKYMHINDWSLRTVLDSPLGVFEFKKFCSKSPRVNHMIDFLIEFEKISFTQSPDLDSAIALMELALQLPSSYNSQIKRLRVSFKKCFGPMAFVSKKDKSLTDKMAIHSELGNSAYSSSRGNSKSKDKFPDETLPSGYIHSGTPFDSILSPYGKNSPKFGGYLNSKQKKRAKSKARKVSLVDTEILAPTKINTLSKKKQKELRKKGKISGYSDAGTGDFFDRQAASRQFIEEAKSIKKAQVVKVFNPLAESLRRKVTDLLKKFVRDSPEFRELVSAQWYSEQKLEVEDFFMFRDLGRGAFGVVSAAKTKTTGALTAIKCMNKRLIKGKKAKRLVASEKAILQILGDYPSNFVIWLKYSFVDKDNFYVALPLCTGGDLAFHLKKSQHFSTKRARFCFAEILEGLDHLHSLNIVYRDMKPDNVIFDYEGHARISDLGLAVQTGGRKIRGKAGTPGYWAPEVISKQPYSFSSDHWSVGCVLFEMIVGICPFSTTNTKMSDRNEATLHWQIKIPKKLHNPESKEPEKDFPKGCKDLILGLLDRDRSRRFGAQDVRRHPFMKTINWFKLRNKMIKPPWKPSIGEIHAPDQLALDDASLDKNYKKLRLTSDDEIFNFEYISKYSHQIDIVKVLETKAQNKLSYDKKYESDCCVCM